MGKIKSTAISSKWIKTKWLLGHSNLTRYVPKTRLFTRGNLQKMLEQYPSVYFKPTNGTGGKGIIRINTESSTQFSTKHNKTIKHHSSISNLYSYLRSFAGGTSYLLQKGINLARTKGNPFDVRVMVQKGKGQGWVPSAIVAKIGKPGKVVTNYHQGGEIATLEKVLSGAGYSRDKIRATRESLNRLGQKVGACFDKHKKGFRELGLDVGIDQAGHFWILEVNTRPCFYPFKHLSKKMYHRVVSYAKEYGRA